jgi:hypothetical protein
VPPIAAIVRLLLRSKCRIMVSREGSAVAFGESNSFTSAPPLKSSSLPIRITAQIAGSASARISSLTMRWRAACESALTGGLSSSMMATAFAGPDGEFAIAMGLGLVC